MLTKSLGICLLALALPRLAAPQTAPDLQKIMDRLDQLENQNRQLLDEIHQLRSELSQGTATPPTSAVAPSAPSEERIGVAENRIAELDQSKVTASQRFPVSLTGMLLFNAFENGRSGTSQYPVAAALTPGASSDRATVRQTIIGLKFNGPALPGGGTASGSINLDFFGGTASPNNNLLRIRTASLDLTWGNTTLSFGQDKPLISPRDPSSFAQVGVSPLTAAGNLWDWNPQVRIEHSFLFGENTGLKAQGAVYETTESYSSTLPTEYSGTLEKSRPAWQGRLEFFHGGDNRRIEVAPGFSISNTHVAGTSIQSTIASVDWLIRPISLVELSGEAFAGQDVAGFGRSAGIQCAGIRRSECGPQPRRMGADCFIPGFAPFGSFLRR